MTNSIWCDTLGQMLSFNLKKNTKKRELREDKVETQVKADVKKVMESASQGIIVMVRN